MLRRLIAVLGTLALAVAYLPGAFAGLADSSAVPDCCNGIMCPMHRMTGDHAVCGMDMGRSGTAFQSCPDNAQRYTSALAFVRVQPSAFFSERIVEFAPTPMTRFPLSADLGVVPPPPRISIT